MVPTQLRSLTPLARLRSICWLIIAVLGSEVLAQESQQKDRKTLPLEEVMVTAQFRAQDLQETPLSITAVNSEMLEARGQTTIAQVAAQAPNVNLAEAPATYGPAVQAFIRGVGQSDSVIALEPGVGIYVDDVYYSTLLGSMLDLLDLERVEILRGPQGTLAGQNSIGGAIKLYSRRPDGEEGGFIQATYGSYHRTELRGAAGFTLVPERLFARISGASVERDGYVTRYDYRCTHPDSPVPSFRPTSGCKLGTEGGKSYVALRGTVRWEINDNAELTIIGDVTRDKSESAPSTLLYVGSLQGPGAPESPPYIINGVPFGTPQGSPFISYSPYGPYAQDTYKRDPYISYENYLNHAPRDGTEPYAAPADNRLNSWGWSAHADIRLTDNLALTSITAYREYDTVYTSAESSPLSIALAANDNEHWQATQELRLSGTVGEMLDYTVGGFYLKKETVAGSRVQLPTLEFSQIDESHQETKAAFANVEWHVTDSLDLIGGVRHTKLSNEFRYGRLGNPGSIYGGIAPPALAPLNGLRVPSDNDRTDYRVVAQYQWTPDLMVYAQFSTGFRSGGANPRPFFPAQALNHGPETLDAYEIGFKSDFWGHRVRLNASAFLNRYDDILVSVSQCPTVPAAPCALPLNAGRADVMGFEVESTIRLADRLLIDTSLSYLDFDYTWLSPLARRSGIKPGMDGPFVQKWRASLGLQYEFDLGGWGTLTPRIDVNYQDRYFANAINRPPFNEIEERTLVNARLMYRTADELWQATLEVTNVNDKLYYDGIFDNRGSTHSIQGRPGRPREWAITIKRNF
ncbi:MAG: TonB-dependent receptor [Spongiibacteraceae bacterium]|jgi:iron complex outermembrane receptor protein|nr:TonB-dependent receptor [Spongiibacteraceae bacterium]